MESASTNKRETGLLRRGRGSLAARVLTVATLCALVGGMLLTSASALAASPPEKPLTIAGPVTATSATFEGTLNPHTEALVGGYFAYSEPNGLTCAEGPSIGLEGFEGEQDVKAQAVHALAELQPDKKYQFCLVATNESGATPGNPVEVVTPAIKPTVASETAGNGSSTTMSLEAEVNPNNEKTSAHLQYSTSSSVNGSGALTTPTVLASSELGEGYGGQAVGNGAVTGLSAGTAYYYQAVATNATGTTYGPVQSFTTVPAPTTDTPSPIAARTATLAGHFTLNATATQYFFRYEAGTDCVREQPVTTASVEAGVGTGTATATTAVTELAPNTRYTVCLVTANAYGSAQGPPVTFTTSPSAPTIADQYATDVTPLSATLNAEIDPGGVDTSYSFEYGETSSYDTKIPLSGAALGSATYGSVRFTAARNLNLHAVPAAGPFSVGQLVGGRGIVPGTEITAAAATHGGFQDLTLSIPVAEGSEDVALFAVSPASQQLQGLHPNTIYHYRVVATNEVGGKVETVDGPDAMFKTVVASSGLPDDRVEELVTPVENHNVDVYDPQLGVENLGEFDNGAVLPFQASTNGDAVTYVGDPGPGGTGASGGGEQANQYLATRTSSGWSQQDISPRSHFDAAYQAFSPDLTNATLLAGAAFREPAALLPETDALAGYGVLYARNNSDASTRALFTSLPAGTSKSEFNETLRFAGGSSPGFETQLFEVSGSLFPGAPQGKDLYESRNGQLSFINTLPDGSVEPEAAFGAPNLEGSEGGPDYSHDISANGTRVFWTGLASHDLYMHEDGAPTVQIDASQAGGPGGGGQFWTASDDGGKIFFTDEASDELTSNTVPASGVNLYEYDVATHALEDLTPAGAAEVQGVLGTSSDGSYVYFVANGVLASGAAQGTCLPGAFYENEASLRAECNLYVRHDGEKTRYIRSLSEKDGLNVQPLSSGGGAGAHGDWVQTTGASTAEVSPTGESMVFVSGNKLTKYENQNLLEVYLYSAASQEIHCVSCDPSGASPQPTLAVSGGEETAAVLPAGGTAPGGGQDLTHEPYWLSADGSKVFFDSFVPLVPEDTNGLVDVYEWEREGSGESCPVTVPARQDGGCVSLLSGGKSNDNSYLFGVSETGSDAFFVTRAQLAEADHNENFDVYDAREGGTRPVNPPACSGTGCQGVPPAPPVFSTPASATFSGVGNLPAGSTPVAKPKPRALTNTQKLAAALTACKRKPKKQRAQCEKQARKRYAVKSKAKHSAKKKGN